MKVVFFDTITVSLPKDKIYSRLGYSKGKTQLKDRQKEVVERYIEDALDFINLKGAGRRVPVAEISPESITLSGGNALKSKSLVKLFSKCSEILFMGATAGKKVVEVIEKNSAGKDITSAVIFDAVASEMVDGALDWIMGYFGQQIRRENKYVVERRFSAGYGDFLLDSQKVMCDILEIDKLGVVLSKEFILLPEKSVTAVAGIMEG